MRRGKKVERKDKAPQQRFTVVGPDARHGKYLFSEDADGFTRDHAEALAAPVAGQSVSYSILPLEVHRFVRELDGPLTCAEAQTAFDAAEVGA